MNATRQFGEDLIQENNDTSHEPATFAEFTGFPFGRGKQTDNDQDLWGDFTLEQGDERQKRKRIFRVLTLLGVIIMVMRMVLLIKSRKDR